MSADCAKICIHAEQMALRAAIEHRSQKFRAEDGESLLGGLEMVHVKVVDGVIVAGGPPSCWQCSREVLDAQLAGFWLYESVRSVFHGCEECEETATHTEHFHNRVRWWCDQHVAWSGHHENCPDPCHALLGREDMWCYYTAEQFHRETLKNCGLHVGGLQPMVHVLWGGNAICESAYLRGVPAEWPDGQTWVGLDTLAARPGTSLTVVIAATSPGDHQVAPCRDCELRWPGIATGLKIIGADPSTHVPRKEKP